LKPILDWIEEGMNISPGEASGNDDLEGVEGETTRSGRGGEARTSRFDGRLLLVVVVRVEGTVLDVDVGNRVDEGEIKPWFEVWMSRLGLRKKEMEETGQLGCSAPCYVLCFLSLKDILRIARQVEERWKILTTSVRNLVKPSGPSKTMCR